MSLRLYVCSSLFLPIRPQICLPACFCLSASLSICPSSPISGCLSSCVTAHARETRVHTNTPTHIHTYRHTRARAYAILARLYAHAHTFAYTHVYIHIYTHARRHTQSHTPLTRGEPYCCQLTAKRRQRQAPITEKLSLHQSLPYASRSDCVSFSDVLLHLFSGSLEAVEKRKRQRL